MAIIPTDDDFTAGATVYGSKLCGYIAATFWTAQNFGSKGPFTIGVNPLHDGYMSPAIAGNGIGQSTGGVLYRPKSTTDDIIARMTQRAVITSGGLDDADRMITMQAVCVRVSGGTVTAGTAPQVSPWTGPQRVVDVTTGYFFGYVTDGSDAEWVLAKMASGTLTTLASETFTGTGKLSEEIDPFLAHRITLDIDAGAGGSVDLYGSIDQATAALPQQTVNDGTYSATSGAGGWSNRVVISHNDNSSPITAEGRCGFISSASHTNGLVDNAGNVAVLIEKFEIHDQGGTYSMVDDGDRWERGMNFQFTQGDPGFLNTSQKVGDLRCGWGGDYHSKSVIDGTLQRGTGAYADRIGVDDTGFDETTPWAGSLFPTQRRTSDAGAQHRRCQFAFQSSTLAGGASSALGAGEFRQAGIGIRASRMTSAPDQGYHVDIRPTENSLAAWVKLYRWEGSLTPTLIAEYLSPTIALNTDYTLAIRAYNADDANGNQNGIVVLEAYLDGVLIVLADPAAGAVSGVQVVSAGTVYDSSSARTIDGEGEFIRLCGPTGTDKATLADAWTELSLDATPSEVESSQLSVSVEDETTNYTATELVLDYEWPVREERAKRTKSWEFDSGHVRTQLQDLSTRRVFNIQAFATTAAERTTLLAFYEARKGPYEGFDFTPPLESSTIKVHFTEDGLATTLEAPGVFSFEFTLEELLD